MREKSSGRHGGFESMEHDNERQPMVSHQSETTPRSVAMDWQAGIFDMKHEAMDEAYGMASKSLSERDFSKAHSQFREYNWS